jgi:hypothetical protein
MENKYEQDQKHELEKRRQLEMDYVKILKRAWETTWRYRALWVFGIILALTTGGGTPSGPNGNGGNGGNGGGGFYPPGRFTWPPGKFPWPPGEFPWPPSDIPWREVASNIVSVLVVVGIGLACVTLLLLVVGTIARYVAETSLIRMVDDHEETGQKRSIREGFRMGWSRDSFRLFLIKLLITLPTVAAFILLLLITGAPLLLWLTRSTALGVIGTVAAVGLFFLFIFLAIIVGTVLSLLIKFFWRACVLEGLGVTDSIRHGFDMVRRHLKDVVIMWLIMVGIHIGWIIALILISILLIPVILLLIVVGGIVGGLPALAVWGLTSIFFEGVVPWILAALIGAPIFILIVAVPWLFLGGLMEVFKSSVWTLTYRELCALESLEMATEIPPVTETQPETETWEDFDIAPEQESEEDA